MKIDLREIREYNLGKARLRYGVRLSEIMRPQHPRWQEFRMRLFGPEGCHFRANRLDPHGTPMWHCKAGRDKTSARRILRQMGFTKGQVPPIPTQPLCP